MAATTLPRLGCTNEAAYSAVPVSVTIATTNTSPARRCSERSLLREQRDEARDDGDRVRQRYAPSAAWRRPPRRGMRRLWKCVRPCVQTACDERRSGGNEARSAPTMRARPDWYRRAMSDPRRLASAGARTVVRLATRCAWWESRRFVASLPMSANWLASYWLLLLRLVLVGLAALFVFGLFERWPRRLPAWFPRWGLQVASVAAVMPVAAALVLCVHHAG